MGASAILKSIGFTAVAVIAKTIAPMQKLYQSEHAIWCERSLGEITAYFLLNYLLLTSHLL